MSLSPVLLSVLVACLILSGGTSVGLAEGRIALLIGNSDYDQPQLDLRNPRNDVLALGEALQAEGFDVIAAIDQDVDGMRRALRDYAARATDARMALFFYAGHGVQMGGENYFLGVDYDGWGARDARARSLNMTEVRETLEGIRAEASFIIVDACRNTPFLEEDGTRPGLVRARGGAGMMIAYATDPGNVALDGQGNNSVFTEALLQHLGTPGLDVRLMFGRVRQQVVLDTDGLQVPWVEEALLGEHVISTDPSPTAVADAVQQEVRRWRRISDAGDPGALEGYLADYPNGLFAEIAEERIGLLTSVRPAASAPDAEVLLASASADGIAAALSTLGVMTRGGTGTASPEGDLATAFERYRSQLADSESAGPERLFRDATRTSMVLASATAQQIRTDIVALRSVDRALGLARDALANVERIASTNPAAEPILAQGRQDVAAIENARETILGRLDQSRDYYDTILTRAARYVPEDASADLLGASLQERSISDIDSSIRSDAALFLDQISRIRQDREGSYIWLADFNPNRNR